MNPLTPYRVLALLLIYCVASALTGCAALEVQTKYGDVAYDGKTIRVIQK